MSFSIPTLKGFVTKFTGTLSSPTFNIVGVTGTCGDCNVAAMSGTITAVAGAKVAFKILGYSDTSSASCSDYQFLTVGNIASFNDCTSPIPPTDDFGPLSRMPNGLRIVAVACSGANFSSPSEVSFSAIPCPSTLSAPTISITSNQALSSEESVVDFTVTSNACGTTYITYGPNFGGGASNSLACDQYGMSGGTADPTDTQSCNTSLNGCEYRCIVGSGAVFTGSFSCTNLADYSIKAKTYFSKTGCTSLSSSITESTGTMAELEI